MNQENAGRKQVNANLDALAAANTQTERMTLLEQAVAADAQRRATGIPFMTPSEGGTSELLGQRGSISPVSQVPNRKIDVRRGGLMD